MNNKLLTQSCLAETTGTNYLDWLISLLKLVVNVSILYSK